MNWFKKNKWQIGCLVLLVLVSYVNGWGAKFVADDVYGIVNNPDIFKFSWVIKNPLIVLGRLEYFLISNLFGVTPWVFRLSNVLTHIGVTVLVLWLVAKLVNKQVGMLTAVLVAVHPILVESVTWISGGGYVKYSFWLLLSFIFYIKAEKENKFLIWSSLAYLFSLQYSEKAVVLPAILVMYRLILVKKRGKWGDLISFLSLSGIWIVANLMQVGNRLKYLGVAYSKVGSGGVNFLIQIPIAISEYLSLVWWPSKLTLYHSEMFFSKIGFGMRGLVVGAMILVELWSLAKSFKGSRIWGRISFWLGWLIIALSPTLTPLGVSWIVAERYFYLGSIGIFVLIAMLIDWLSRKEGWREGVMIGFSTLVALLMVRTIVRNTNWQTPDKLWLSAEQISPNSPQNNNNLGDLYGRRGDLKRAEEHFLRAIKINPNYAEAMHNLANTYVQMGKFDQAKKYYRKALEKKPELWQSKEQLKKLDEYLKTREVK